jgi:hypothetical protein
VHFSNNTLSRRINDLSSYVETTGIQRVKKSQYYALQLDESTDVANVAIVLVFVRYINEDTGIAEEELLFFRSLKERTTGEDNIQSHKCLICLKRNRLVSLHWFLQIWGHINDGLTCRICSSVERGSNKRLLDSLLYL